MNFGLVVVFIAALLQSGLAQEAGSSVDWQMVASIREKTAVITEKNRENEALLLNILPRPLR